MTATIPLAKGFDLSKMEWPAYLSIKRDGVPVKMTFDVDNQSVEVVSRSDKPVPSVSEYAAEILRDLAYFDFDEGTVITMVAEVTHTTLKAFKDVSGVVRKKEPQTDLVFNVFDFEISNYENACFDLRIRTAQRIVYGLALPWLLWEDQYELQDQEEAEALIEQWQAEHIQEEGFILVSANRLFKPNSRHWDYQKIVVDPTIDLNITGYEEAVSKDGQPLGMVGRLIADFNGTEIGIGPGKLTHAERIALWDTQNGEPALACIKYKRDPSYDALRQPTFQHWRYDKEEPNNGLETD